MIETQLSHHIKSHALACYPRESCGVVVDGTIAGRDISGTYIPLENVHPTPEIACRISKEDLLRFSGRMTAFVHSHPDGESAPSGGDMLAQEKMDVPFIIVATNGVNCDEPFEFGDCLPPLPLLGRPFRHAVTDCYELMRDYWFFEFGTRLKNIPRDWGWWNHDLDLYRDYFEPAGFRKLEEGEEPQKHDCFFLCIGSRVPNHGGIYLGNGEILHHLGSSRNGAYSPTHLSTKEYGTRYTSLRPMFVRFKEPLP